MHPLIRIPAVDIHVEGLEVCVALPASWLDEALGDCGLSALGQANGQLSGRLSRSEDDIVVRCRVKASLAGTCVRCLDPAPIEVTADMSVLLTMVPRAPARGAHEGKGAKRASRAQLGRDEAARERLSDGRAGGARSADARLNDGRAGDARLADARLNDGRSGDARLADARLNDGRAGDARLGRERSSHAHPDRERASRPGPGRSSEAAHAKPSRARASRSGAASEDLDGYEFTAREAETDVYDGETVVLDALVREAILLEVPNFPLCSEECPGIRPAPDRALGFAAVAPTPVDPRLAPLGAFRKKLGGAATLDDLVAAAAERSAAMGRKPVLRSSARPTTKIPAAKKSAAKKPAANEPAANQPAANKK